MSGTNEGMNNGKQPTEMENIISMLDEILNDLATNTDRYRQVLSKLDNRSLESEQPSDASDAKEEAPSTHIAVIKSLGQRIRFLNKKNSEILEPLEQII